MPQISMHTASVSSIWRRARQIWGTRAITDTFYWDTFGRDILLPERRPMWAFHGYVQLLLLRRRGMNLLQAIEIVLHPVLVLL
jgi:hypothetical protein